MKRWQGASAQNIMVNGFEKTLSVSSDNRRPGRELIEFELRLLRHCKQFILSSKIIYIYIYIIFIFMYIYIYIFASSYPHLMEIVGERDFGGYSSKVL